MTAGANRTVGRLTFYPGDYDYYLDKSKATSERTALTERRDASEVNGQKPEVRKQTGSGSKKHKAQKRLEAETRNAIAKARREKEKRVHELETKIAALERQQKELTAALEDPAAYTPGGHDLQRLGLLARRGCEPCKQDLLSRCKPTEVRNQL